MRDMTASLKEEYLVAVEAAGLGLGQVDYVANTVMLDDRAAALLDLPADSPVPRGAMHDRIHPDDRDEVEKLLALLLEPTETHAIDVKHRVVHSDGTVVWVSVRKKVTFEDRGHGLEPVSGVLAIMDITEHKVAQEHNRFLIEELNHRSRNLLTVVQSIVRRTFRTGNADTFEERVSLRLNGLLRNAEALSKDTWQNADLEELALAQLSPFVQPDSVRVILNGPATSLPPTEAQAIGMAFHELATNAVKYGALSGPDGRIDLSWGVAEDDPAQFEIRWAEVGGPPVTEPEGAGFGTSVTTEQAAYAVKGKVSLTYPPEGVVWCLRMPKDAIA
ncbi:PAS domain-containing protein [Rhodobacterales bacterium HKCCE4037]|nr:PAS domain-containing protein [Rhodobacterales bacterium HKCCE4037]